MVAEALLQDMLSDSLLTLLWFGCDRATTIDDGAAANGATSGDSPMMASSAASLCL